MSVDHGRSEELPLITLLHQAERWFSEAMLARLAHAGVGLITPAHITVLRHLADLTRHDAPVTIAALARRAGVTRQTMHRAVTQLTNEGLLTTSPGSGFPQSSVIDVTTEGAARLTAAAAILSELEDALAAQLGTSTFTALRRGLTDPWPDAGQPQSEDTPPMGHGAGSTGSR